MTPQEFLQKAEQIAQNTAKTFKNRKSINTNIPRNFVISYEEFHEKYGAGLYLENAGFQVLVFDGDLNLNTNLNSDLLKQQFENLTNSADRRAVFVNGNLNIDGDILDNDWDNYLFLQVAGDVYCHYLYSENGTIVIKGNLTALLGTAGEYNDGMLAVYGTTTAPYIVSNDHAMPDKSQSDYIFIGNGQIGETYYGGISGWDYFKDSHFMLKEDILENEYQVNLAVFFEYVKKGENPFVGIEDYQAQKHIWEEKHSDEITEEQKQKEEISKEWEKYHESNVVKGLYLYNDFLGNDDELYDYIVNEYRAIQEISDENDRYSDNEKMALFAKITERMAEEWRIVAQYYPAEKVETLRKIIIQFYNDAINYFSTLDNRGALEFLYPILKEYVINIEKDENYLHETLVRVGLKLEDYEDTYAFVSSIDKHKEYLPELYDSIKDVIESEGYRAWLAKQ